MQMSEAGSANREKQTVNSLHNFGLHPQRGHCSGKKKKESTQAQCTKNAEEAPGVGEETDFGRRRWRSFCQAPEVRILGREEVQQRRIKDF